MVLAVIPKRIMRRRTARAAAADLIAERVENVMLRAVAVRVQAAQKRGNRRARRRGGYVLLIQYNKFPTVEADGLIIPSFSSYCHKMCVNSVKNEISRSAPTVAIMNYKRCI